MNPTLRAARRGMAAGVVSALALGGIALVATPVQATVAPSLAEAALSWNVSKQFQSHMSVKTGTDGASFDATEATFDFPLESVTYGADGSVEVDYSGTAKGAFAFGGNELYSVTVKNPTVVVEADGSGRLEATAFSKGTRSNPDLLLPEKRVTVAEFASSKVAGGEITATPKWDGVLAWDSAAAVELGVGKAATAEKPAIPVGGASFSPEFLGALHGDVNSTFFASGSSSDANKAPGQLSLDLRDASQRTQSVEVSVVEVSPEFGATVKVVGKDFAPAQGPGDDGLYAGVFDASTKVDFSDRNGGTELAAGVTWIAQADISAKGGFSVDVNVPVSKLSRAKEYVVLTWQAHTYSNKLQDTRTPVSFDLSALPIEATNTTLAVDVKTPLTAALTAKVAPGIAGKVTFKNGTKTVGVAAVKNGVATLKLSGVAAGKQTYTAQFAPQDAKGFASSTSKAVSVTVAKAASKTTLKVAKKATIKKAGSVKVAVAAGSLKATGKVKVSIKAPNKKKAVVKTVSLKNGAATVALPKAGKKGTYKVAVSYAGDKNLKAAAKKTVTFKVKK